MHLYMRGEMQMKNKIIAIMMFELVDESAEEENEKLMQELHNWFRENAGFIPWVKEIRSITAKEE